jgi:TonB family protein
MKRIAVIFLSLFVGLVSFSAGQEVPKTISGGVLNGKAYELPKPSYPPAARAVGASGAVSVQVLIDENGGVISAKAVSGHPLLQAAAVEAARGAKFAPTRLSGVPVRVAGIITYNFVGALSATKLGFVLAHAEETSSFGAYGSPASLSYQLPPSWDTEKQILTSLTFDPPPSANGKTVVKTEPPPNAFDAAPVATRDTNRYTVKGDVSFSAANVGSYGEGKVDAKSISSLKQLSSLIESRAAVNPQSAWAYELGRVLGSLVADSGDQASVIVNISKLEALADRAPASASAASLDQLKEFIQRYKAPDAIRENRPQFLSKAEALANLRY